MGSKLSKSKKNAKAEEKKADETVNKTEATTTETQTPQEEKKPEEKKAEEKKPEEEKPAEEKPAEEKPATVAEEKPAEEKPAAVEEKPAEEKPEVVAVVETKEETKLNLAGALDQAALDQLWYKAATEHGFTEQKVEVAEIEKALELALLGPTAYNCSPIRVAIISTPEGKEKLIKAVAEFAPGNVEQTTQAPINLIVCADKAFEDRLDYLMPAVPNAAQIFKGPHHDGVMDLNSSLQGGYLIMALRALGFGVGPQISGPQVDAAFDLAAQGWSSKFLINVGYGVPEKRYPRAPRLSAQTESFDPENSAAIRK